MDTNLSDIAELHTFRRDDYLIHAEEASDYLYFLVSGNVICFTCTAQASGMDALHTIRLLPCLEKLLPCGENRRLPM